MDTASSAPPSLNGTFKPSEVTASLTEAGLLPGRTQKVVRLYAELLSWAKAREQWHAERMHERGSRSSAQKIFRIIKRRLQAGEGQLPAVTDLNHLLQSCGTEQARNQVLYLYLINEDNLFRYVVHEVLGTDDADRTNWNLSKHLILDILNRFEYDDGSPLTYADSTRSRWVQGFLSVLRDIGVVEGKYDEYGTPPTIDAEPLHTAALYSWRTVGDDWLQHPVGLRYLFQPRAMIDRLVQRLGNTEHWQVYNQQGTTLLTPVPQE